MMKNRLLRLANCAIVSLRRPVSESGTAPVAVWYCWNASTDQKRRKDQRGPMDDMEYAVPEAINVKVVPVSTMPLVLWRIG